MLRSGNATSDSLATLVANGHAGSMLIFGLEKESVLLKSPKSATILEVLNPLRGSYANVLPHIDDDGTSEALYEHLDTKYQELTAAVTAWLKSLRTTHEGDKEVAKIARKKPHCSQRKLGDA